MMKAVVCRKQVLGKEIIAHAICTENGITVTIGGGDLAHVGAVSIVDERGVLHTHAFSEHREAVITERWAHLLYSLMYQPVVISAGIHYDGITKEEILEVVHSCDELYALLVKKLKEGQA